MMKPLFLLLLASCYSIFAWAISPSTLRCENRVEPRGIDVAKPKLAWILDSGKQTAYQLEVEGVWDSGKVVSDQSVAIEYAGPALASQTRYLWRVRAWNQDGVPGEWSDKASFITGVLGKPWQAKWISDGQTAPEESEWLGYHASEEPANDGKWLQVDLGKSVPIDSVVLGVLVHDGANGYGFPLRYRIEASNDAAFTSPTMIMDRTGSDLANPGKTEIEHAASVSARYVRVTATKLFPHKGRSLFALSEIRVISKNENVAVKCPVTFKDTIDGYGWNHLAATDGVGSMPSRKLPVFKKDLVLNKEVSEAVLSICGLGHYELFLNGQKVGDELLAPGWSNYRKICLYDTFDLTKSLRGGAN